MAEGDAPAAAGIIAAARSEIVIGTVGVGGMVAGGALTTRQHSPSLPLSFWSPESQSFLDPDIVLGLDGVAN